MESKPFITNTLNQKRWKCSNCDLTNKPCSDKCEHCDTQRLNGEWPKKTWFQERRLKIASEKLKER